MKDNFCLPENQMLISFVRLLKISYQYEVWNNEGNTLNKDYTEELEDTEIEKSDLPINFKLVGKKDLFKKYICITIPKICKNDIRFLSSDTFLKIFDFILIEWRKLNKKKKNIIISFTELASFLGVSSSSNLKSNLIRSLDILCKIKVTYLNKKNTDADEKYTNYVDGEILSKYRAKAGSYSLELSKDFYMYLFRNIKIYVQIPSELYSSTKFRKFKNSFYYARSLYIHYRLNAIRNIRNVIKVSAINDIAADPEGYDIPNRKSYYKNYILKTFVDNMEQLNEFITYKFIDGTPQDFALFCKSKIEFELLNYDVRIKVPKKKEEQKNSGWSQGVYSEDI